MKTSLLGDVIRLGAWRDLVIPCGRQAQGVGDPWYPPDDVVAIDCRAIYTAAWHDKSGRQAWGAFGETNIPASHAQEILDAFDNGPEKFNPPIVAPFANTWLEWGHLDPAVPGVKLGTFVAPLPDDSVCAWHIITWPGIAQPFFIGAWSTDKTDWHTQGFRMYPSTLKWISTGPDDALARMFSSNDDDEAARRLFADARLITATHLALRLPNTRIATLQDAPVKMAKKQKRTRPHQRVVWKELVMCGSQGGQRRQAARGNGQALRAEHVVRSNIALYTDDAPLFGKPGMVGWFERPEHRRGNRKNGLIKQLRRIEPA